MNKKKLKLIEQSLKNAQRQMDDYFGDSNSRGSKQITKIIVGLSEYYKPMYKYTKPQDR